MASSKLMASSTSRNSDLNRKLSPCASTSSAADFLRIGSSINNARDNFESYYVELNPGGDHGQGLGAEAESSSSTLLSAEIMLLDAAGAIAPISDGELEHRRVVRKTVDDVWREIVAGKQREKQPKEEMMTLEDFLVKAGAVEGSSPATREFLKVKEERLSGGICLYESKSGVIGSEVGGMGLDVGDLGRRRGKRSLSLLEPLDKVAQQRQRRMIKNRESAARSRERKQAYQVELESIAMRLEEENSRLLKEKAEQSKKRLKQVSLDLIDAIPWLCMWTAVGQVAMLTGCLMYGDNLRSVRDPRLKSAFQVVLARL